MRLQTATGCEPVTDQVWAVWQPYEIFLTLIMADRKEIGGRGDAAAVVAAVVAVAGRRRRRRGGVDYLHVGAVGVIISDGEMGIGASTSGLVTD